MAGQLSVVCTPIGNLSDMSPRAVDELRHSALVFAEDTRRSRTLFQALQISLEGKKLLSLNQRNENRRIEVAFEWLEKGDLVSIVTDAGAPSISDPGGRLVDEIAKAGYEVRVLPGPSALVAALMGAGLISHRFVFLGFLPRKGREREQLIRKSNSAGFAIVLFESPLRAEKTLRDLHCWCGAKRVVVARELTKKFETFHRGRLGEKLSPPLLEKGEMVIVVEAGTQETSAPESSKNFDLRMEELRQSGTSTNDIAKSLAKEYGISKKAAYQQVIGKEP